MSSGQGGLSESNGLWAKVWIFSSRRYLGTTLPLRLDQADTFRQSRLSIRVIVKQKSFTLAISGNYTIVEAFFLLQRRLGYYMIQLYLPCIFLVMLSWIVFWMSPDNGGDRLTVGITCILTIVFLLGYVNGMLPKV